MELRKRPQPGSLEETFAYLDAFKHQGLRSLVFRGEARYFQTVYPVLDRELLSSDLDKRERLLLERKLFGRFTVEAQRVLVSNSDKWWLADPLRTIALMRHYGLPTRLVDWSRDIYTAAYFAVRDDDGHDGYLRHFDIVALERAIHTRYAEFTRRINHLVDEDGLNVVPEIFSDRFLSFGDWIMPLHVPYDHAFALIHAQSGLFTISSAPQIDHWESIEALFHEDERPMIDTHGSKSLHPRTMVIAAPYKPAIREWLEMRGYNDDTVCPNIQHAVDRTRSFFYELRDSGVYYE